MFIIRFVSALLLCLGLSNGVVMAATVITPERQELLIPHYVSSTARIALIEFRLLDYRPSPAGTGRIRVMVGERGQPMQEAGSFALRGNMPSPNNPLNRNVPLPVNLHGKFNLDVAIEFVMAHPGYNTSGSRLVVESVTIHQ